MSRQYTVYKLAKLLRIPDDNIRSNGDSESEIGDLWNLFGLAKETTPENFLDTRCKDNRCAENASPHFCLLRHYIWYLKSFRESVRWQPVKRIPGGFLFQILGREKGAVSFSTHRLFCTVFSK